jgi:hypothetical protein
MTLSVHLAPSLCLYDLPLYLVTIFSFVIFALLLAFLLVLPLNYSWTSDWDWRGSSDYLRFILRHCYGTHKINIRNMSKFSLRAPKTKFHITSLNSTLRDTLTAEYFHTRRQIWMCKSGLRITVFLLAIESKQITSTMAINSHSCNVAHTPSRLPISMTRR